MVASTDPIDIAGRLGVVREHIAEACARAHREVASVRLVLASKTQLPAAVATAYAAGARDFGENYVQEAIAKRAVLADFRDARWHMIGHLQTNKARDAVAHFDLIHTLDDLRLANAIARVHPVPPLPVLIEVNLGAEASKHGVSPESAAALLDSAHGSVDVRGLMTIPPPSESPGGERRWFAQLREIRDRLALASGLALKELSMGMTDDYEVAIEEGATIVRVGRAVFGERLR